MKKAFGIVCLFAAFSCAPKDQRLRETIAGLEEDKDALTNNIAALQGAADALGRRHEMLSSRCKQLRTSLNFLKNLEAGKRPVYVLRVSLKQVHYSLSISKHIKDAMNEISFDLPVDEAFYGQVSIGSDLIEEFRKGSFWVDGSFGKWRIRVTGKQVKWTSKR